MAGSDDDVLIKIATDISQAIQQLGQLFQSSKDLAEGFKLIQEHAEKSGLSTQQIFEMLSKYISAFGDATEAAATKLAGTADVAVGAIQDQSKALDVANKILGDYGITTATVIKGTEDLGKTLGIVTTEVKDTGTAIKDTSTQMTSGMAAWTQSAVAAKKSTEGIKDAVTALKKEREDAAASFASLSQKERAEIAANADKLRESGMAFKEIAEKANLSTTALHLLIEEQKNLAQAIEDAKGPLERLTELETELHDKRVEASKEYEDLSIKERELLLEKIETLDKAGVSIKEMSDATGLSTEAIQEFLKEEAKFKQDMEDARDPIDKLTSALDELAQQEAKNAEEFAHYSEAEKTRMAELVAAMLLKDQSLQKISETLGVTTGATELFIKSQKDVIDAFTEANKPVHSFFEHLVGGYDKSMSAAVMWGNISTEAVKAFANEIKNAITAFPQMVQGMADVGDEISTMSNRLNITAEAVAELQYIAGQTGAKMEQMARSIQTFGSDVADSSSKASKGLRAMGLTLKDLGDTKEEQFFNLIKKIQDLPEGVDKSAKAIELFGTKFRNSTMLLNEPIDKLRARFKELGGPDGIGQLAKSGDEWNDAVADMTVAMDSFKRSIVNSILGPMTEVVKVMPKAGGAMLVFGQSLVSVTSSLVPMIAQLVIINGPEKGLAGLADRLKGAAGHFHDFGKSAADVGTKFAKMGQDAGGAKGVFTAFGDILKGGVKGLLEFGQSLLGVAKQMGTLTLAVLRNTAAMLVNPYVLAAAAIAALLYGIYRLIGGWDGLVKAFNAVKAAMEPIIKFFGNLLGIAKILAAEFTGKLVKGIESTVQWFQNLWKSAGDGESTLSKIIEGVKTFLKVVLALSGPVGLALLAIWTHWDKIADAAGRAYKSVKGFLEGIGKAVQAKYDVLNETGKKEAALAAQDYMRRRKEVADYEAMIASRKTGAQKLAEENKRLNDLVNGLDKTLKANLTTWLKDKSAKEIAIDLAGDLKLSVEETTAVIERFDRIQKEAAKEGKKGPFAQLQASAKELTLELKSALNSMVPFKNTVEEFGKQAADIAEKAALYGSLKTISPEIIKVADAFNAAQIKEKLTEVNKEALQVSRTFSTDMRASALAASAAMKGMNDEITASFLTGSELRMFQIKKEQDAKLAGIANETNQAKQKIAANILAAEEQAAKEIKIEEAHKKAGQAVNAQVLADIEQRKQMTILAANLELMNVEAMAQERVVIAEKLAEHLRQVETKTTKDFELNMRLYGIVTQKAADDQVKIEQDKFDKLAALAKDHPFFKSQADQQEIVLEGALIAADAYEKTMKAMGVVTERSAQHQLQIERKKLADMERLQLPWMASQIKAQKAVVDAAEKNASAEEKRLKELGIVSKAVSEKRVADEKATLDALIALKDPHYAWQILKQKEVLAQAEEANGKMKVSWTGALSSITEAFSQLAQISGGTFGGMMKSIGMVAGQLNVMSKSLGKDGLKKMWGEAGGGLGGIKGIAKDFGGVGDGFTKTLGGLMKGMGTIMPMAGAIISGVTAAIGIGKKLWDGFTESKGEKAAKDVGKRFGVTITEEMGDAIAKSAKEMFKGDQLAGEIYNLDKIIQAAGGVTAKNFDKLAGNLAETFDLVKKGKMTAEQAQEVLGKNFGAFADHVIKSGKIASEAFQKIIKQNAESGTNSAEVIEFVVGQTTRLGTALSKMGGPFDKVAKLTDDLAKAQDKVKEGRVATPEQAAEIAKLTEEVNKAKLALGDTGVAMGRFERLAVAGFNAAIKSGASYLDAMQSMGPALDTIVKAHKALGTTAGPAIEELLRFREVADGNKELVESAGSLNEVMLALSNIGGLTADTMKDLQEQGTDTFAALQAAGFSEKQSLQQMKGFLEQVRTAHTQMGLPIDENTQKMIDQAEQQGILAKEQISTNEVLREGLSAVIEALGGKIPDAFKKMAAASAEAAAKTKASFSAAADGVKTTEQAVLDLENSSANMAKAGSAEWQKYQDAVAKWRTELENGGGSLEKLQISVKIAEQAVIDLNKAGYDTAAEGTAEFALYQQAVERWRAATEAATAAAVTGTDDVSGAVDGVIGKLAQADWEVWAANAVEMAETVGTGLDDTVNASLEDGNKKLKEANWAGYASKAAAAGSVSKGAVDKVTGSVKGVQNSLDGTDWEGWSQDAVDAAKAAEDAVNGVSMGHSPGGIKEIPLKLFEAMRAFKQWERQGVISAEAVERAVYGVGDTAGSVGQMNAAIEHGEVQVKYASDRKQEGLADIVRAIGEQLEEAATTEKPVNVAITTIDSMSMEQAVESKILPAIEKAIRNNRRQTRSNLRQVLGVRGVGE